MEDAMKNLTRYLTGAALCAVCASAPAPAPAFAQASPAGAEAAEEDEARGDIARATQLYREGNEAFKQKRWSDAELKYLKAWGLVRSFDIAANLGEVQLQLNKPRSAATFLSFALRTAPPSTKPEQLARIRHFLGEAKAQVGTLRVRAMNVAEVEVYLDGERVPEEAARHELYLEPGEHVLLMRHAGYEDAVLRVITGPGLTETIAHRLKPKAEKAPGAAGAAGAEAAGAPAAAGPRAGNDAPPAKLPETTAAPREARSWVPVIALGAASAVGLGLGVGFTVASNGASADAHAQREAILRDGPGCLNASGAVAERCAQFSRTMARSDRFRDMAGVTFIASGTVALAALAVALWPQSGRTQVSAVRVIPELRGDSTGLSLFGAWQ
ncbi:PEGA domain-containing protein [Sorangium sp. So ce513]|uniref:PEGA domain-containing protein n=1 Tax=Sorangium sp. So ce513 TaxID=3133315 RepID=UPI003F637D6C